MLYMNKADKGKKKYTIIMKEGIRQKKYGKLLSNPGVL